MCTLSQNHISDIKMCLKCSSLFAAGNSVPYSWSPTSAAPAEVSSTFTLLHTESPQLCWLKSCYKFQAMIMIMLALLAGDCRDWTGIWITAALSLSQTLLARLHTTRVWCARCVFSALSVKLRCCVLVYRTSEFAYSVALAAFLQPWLLILCLKAQQELAWRCICMKFE